MLSVNQRRWRKSTGIESSEAEIKTVSVHMHDYFVANFVPSLAVEEFSQSYGNEYGVLC